MNLGINNIKLGVISITLRQCVDVTKQNLTKLTVD